MCIKATVGLVSLIGVISAFGCIGRPGGGAFRPTAAADFITMPKSTSGESVEDNKGREVLLASDRAYSTLGSYVGTVNLTADYSWPGGSQHETRWARMYYRAPGNLRIEANDSNNDRFYIVANDRTGKCAAWSGSAISAESSGSVHEVLMEYSGVSLHTSLLLPSILLRTVWHAENFFVPNGSLLPAFATQARYQGEVTIDGVACHKVACERQIGTWTFYVGVEDSILRRIENTESDGQAAIQREHGGAGTSGLIGRSLTVQDFSIDAIDVDLDDDLFLPIDGK
jgi:hypothetical protein